MLLYLGPPRRYLSTGAGWSACEHRQNFEAKTTNIISVWSKELTTNIICLKLGVWRSNNIRNTSMPQILIAGTVPVISVIRIIQPPFRALPVQQMVPSHDWLSVQYSEMLGSFSGTKTCRIRRLCHVPTACKRNAYLALVRPLLEYGAPVWDPHQKQDIDRMERVQRTAVRFISRDYRSRTPGFVASLLTKHNLPTLQERREHLRLGLYYKVVGL